MKQGILQYTLIYPDADAKINSVWPIANNNITVMETFAVYLKTTVFPLIKENIYIFYSLDEIEDESWVKTLKKLVGREGESDEAV